MEGAVMALVFARESLMAVWDEAMVLAKANAAETFVVPEAFDPNREQYQEMEKAGVVRMYTARTRQGELVGYQLMQMFNHPHAKSNLWAQQHTFYMRPDHRGKQAIRFCSWTDTQLQTDGCSYVLRASSIKKPWGNSLKSMGYTETETMYLGRL
jgi:hypothetical protein